jgi:hypothetical protein
MVIWASLAIDLSSLVFLVMGFRSLTSAMVAVNNYWEASFDQTDDCDHRGNPRFFNPNEQMVLGQASLFVALVTVLLLDFMSDEYQQAYNHYYSPIWSTCAVSSCHLLFCKRKITNFSHEFHNILEVKYRQANIKSVNTSRLADSVKKKVHRAKP